MAKQVIMSVPEFTFWYEKIGESIFLHFECRKWSAHWYSFYKNELNAYLQGLKKLNIEYVYVVIPDNDPKLLKFEKMFGFEVVSTYPNVLILRRSTNGD